MGLLFRFLSFGVLLTALPYASPAGVEMTSPTAFRKLRGGDSELFQALFPDESASLSPAQITQLLEDADQIALRKRSLPAEISADGPIERRLESIDGLQRLFRADLRESLAPPSAEEIGNFQARNPERFVRKPSAVLYQIFFKADAATATPEEIAQAKSKAEAALRRLHAGESFGSVAGDVSEAGVSRLRGGAVGTVHPDSINPQLAQIVFSMSPGEIRGPLYVKHGWYILKVTSMDKATAYSEQEKSARAKQMLLAQKFEEAYQAALDRATTEIQPRQYPISAEDYNSSAAVWLKTADGTTFPARMVYLYGQEKESLTPGDWSESVWKEQAEALKASATLAQFANVPGFEKHPDYDRAMALVNKVRLRNRFWNWVYATYTPSEPELREHFNKYREQFRPLPEYTGAFLKVPVVPAADAQALTPLERHNRLEPIVYQLNKLLQENSSATLEQLLPKIQQKWPDATVRKFERATELGPVIEAELGKLREGGRSAAFEGPIAVFTVELHHRMQNEPNLQNARDLVIGHWKQTVLQETSPTLRAKLLGEPAKRHRQ